MSLDSIAIVAEVMSWVGLGVGIPMLILGRILRANEAAWRTVDILVIEQPDRLIARWFADGSIHERPLRAREAFGIGEGWHEGRVSTRDADYMKFTHPPVFGPTLSTLGGIFLGAGVIGFALSWLPLFV